VQIELPKSKTTILIAAIGVLLCSAVTLTSVPKEYFLEMLPGMIMSWIPYAVTVIAATQTKSSKFRQSLNGGLLLYLVIDLVVRYDALHRSTSSTSAIGVLLVIFASVIIIPAGAGLTYLALAFRK
jgi:F0F1-type ATP synthase assembly protein I